MGINGARKTALAIITDYKNRNREDLIKALFDLRHNAEHGDEPLLYPLLGHTDDGVVASALYSLTNVYGRHGELAALIRRLAFGDPRDTMEMPIQSTAIALLAAAARSDQTARIELRQIAESASTADVPRERAWQCLASLYGVDWLPNYTEEMIMSPESDVSNQIRERIRRAIESG